MLRSNINVKNDIKMKNIRIATHTLNATVRSDSFALKLKCMSIWRLFRVCSTFTG